MNLNDQQLAAVMSNAVIRAVIAGPGSGKTRTLTESVKHSIKIGAHPGRIVILTFTNGGAHEFTERLRPMKLKYSGTRHGLMFRLLQKHGQFLGYLPGTISIIPKGAADELLTQTALRLGFTGFSNKKLKQMKSSPKMATMFPEGDLVWREFYHTLKRNNLVDYDKILEDGLRIIELGVDPEIDELYVDEKQDDNAVDWRIDLAIPARRKFFVGDPDQSIFGFRGSRPDLFVEFTKRADVETFILDKCYRCNDTIARAATNLISHNENRVVKDVVAMHGDNLFIIRPEFQTEHEEIASLIHAATSGSAELNKTAILVRTNHLVSKISQMFVAHGLATQVQAVDLPMDWTQTLTLLSLLLNPSNDVLAERWMRMRMGASEVNELKVKTVASGKRLAEALGDRLELVNGVEGVPQKLAQLGISEASVQLVSKRITLLPQDPPLLADLIQDVFNHENWNETQNKEGVYIGTIHGAKGKEWNRVVIVGCEQGMLPAGRTDLEEERRVMFVAVTRAKDVLALSICRKRSTPWGTLEREPSQFIEEMGI